MTYDSRPDTWKHINEVQKRMGEFVAQLQQRALVHDQSKLREPELSGFNEATPKLRDLTYGSEEYMTALEDLKPILSHHYEANSHHPEHYPGSLRGMTLMDIVEMFCDWKAASMRHNDGDFAKSLKINQARFQIDPILSCIFLNTMDSLGWEHSPCKACGGKMSMADTHGGRKLKCTVAMCGWTRG